MKTFYTFFLLVLFLIPSLRTNAQDSLWVFDVLTSLDTPWEILWGPDDYLWVSERNGRVQRIGINSVSGGFAGFVPDVQETGEAGLLGMAVNIEDDTIRVYVVYANSVHNDVRLVRFDFEISSKHPGNRLVNSVPLLTGLPLNAIHVGSRLKIVEGKLFMTFGDAASAELAQDPAALNGKILRMNLDGTAPDDNPWANSPYPYNLIWSTGHRNPQGLVFGPNGILYSSEHGPNTDDEINIIEKGRNYGWPNVQGYCDTPLEVAFCTGANVAEPIKAWTPTLAVAGLEYYQGTLFPDWNGSLLLTTLKENDLRLLKLSSDGKTIVEEKIYLDKELGRLRDVCVSPEGRVFVAVSNKDGRGTPKNGDDRIVELAPAGPLPIIHSPTSPTFADSIVCIKENFEVSFATTGNFAPGNRFFLNVIGEPGKATGAQFDSTIIRSDSQAFTVESIQTEGQRLRFSVFSTRPYIVGDTSDFMTVAQRPIVTVGSLHRTLCGDQDSIVLTAKVTPGTAGSVSVRWSTGDTTLSIVVRDSGLYQVTAFDPYGCTWEEIPITVTKQSLPEVSIKSGKRTICEGDSLVLEADGFGGSQFRWSTGEESFAITVKEAGTYWVEATSSDSCIGRSAEVNISVVAPPPQPEITRDGFLLTASAADSFQWYKNGELIPGATGQEYQVTANGEYSVGVRNAAGCESLSDPVSVQVSSVEDGAELAGNLSVYPHPVSDQMVLQFGRELYGLGTITLIDMEGKEVLRLEKYFNGENRKELSLQGIASGGYLLNVRVGQKNWSSHITVKR